MWREAKTILQIPKQEVKHRERIVRQRDENRVYEESRRIRNLLNNRFQQGFTKESWSDPSHGEVNKSGIQEITLKIRYTKFQKKREKKANKVLIHILKEGRNVENN